jgi:hypothetical protein
MKAESQLHFFGHYDCAFYGYRYMPSNRITPSSSLLETLRALALERTQDTQRGSKAGKPDPKDKQHAVSYKHDVQALRQRLRDLASDTDLGDEQSMVQARNRALREILLWEFGTDFRTDSQFLQIVDAIGKSIEADPGLQQRLADLMVDLRKV